MVNAKLLNCSCLDFTFFDDFKEKHVKFPLVKKNQVNIPK